MRRFFHISYVSCLVFWSATGALSQELHSDTQAEPVPKLDEAVLLEESSSVDLLTPLSIFFEPLENGGTSPRMVLLPAGEFEMGCLTVTDCSEDEVPAREVGVNRFAVSQFEITFDHYEIFAKASLRTIPGDSKWGRGSRPAIHVSWFDAVAYTKWLSTETGATYRLPTEAEWEYAARAGTDTKYSWGDDIQYGKANCDGCNSGDPLEKTTEVGQFEPNPWHLYDIHGNVWEWTLDCWNRNYGKAPTDGTAWTTGDCARRVVRGGSWIASPFFVRSATRHYYSAENRVSLVGFRIVREIDSKSLNDS
ncbi:MAG: formylglycine-generating enzyme family protein [Gammaproteobacteria bacterium]|nr:formylglycine-generating enzyme family protein [Gammaproteobacteria bacterium]MYF38294.1 formylglycine-generating enzyme family protein [Gammaproteobacteria bacterium]